MCGIAGWVDFQRDLTQQRATVRAMTATMACRGPDAEELWVAPHAVLGHRRLAVIDLEGGRQPMVAEVDGRPVAVITYCGEVYNFRELRGELVSRGHRFRTTSDTEVVLRAYLEWGDGCAERLNGMYAMAVWDVRRERLLLARDHMGIKPLYYSTTPTGVLFGCEPKAILANALVQPAIDADGMRELLGYAGTPGHGLFRGMKEVRPGHVVQVRREGITPQRYWTLEARPHTDDLQTTLATIRGLLDDIVARQLVADVPLCTLLSGGLDSSTITAFAAQTLRTQGADPIRSFAVEFAGDSEHFRPDPIRGTPDAPYAAEVARHVGTDHTAIVLETADLVDPVVRAATLRAQDRPTALGDMDSSLFLLMRAVREHSTVALSGESADEVFGGYAWIHDPELAYADTFPWVALAQRHAASSGLGTGLLDRDLRKHLDIPTYCADRYREALAETPLQPEDTGRERRMRQISYLHLTRWLQHLLARKDRLSMAVGLEVRVPFCDHRLVEYVYNTPWTMKTFDGREKSLLRAAAAELLPSGVLARGKTPFPVTQDPAYARALRGELRELVAQGDAPIAPLLDHEAAGAVLADPRPASSWRNRANVEMVLGLNAWLSRYGVRLAI